MAFTNSDIFKSCLYIVNKEGLSGGIRIDDFNLLLKQASTLLLKEKLGLSNDYQLGFPKSKNQKGLSTISDDQIIQFKARATISFSSGIGALPTSPQYFKYDDVRVSGALEPVEVLTSSELTKRLNNAIDAPDILFPVAEILGSSIYIYPTTIGSATLTFYRYPVTPIFDFYINAVGGIVPLAFDVDYTLQADEVASTGQTSGSYHSTTIEHEWLDDCAIELVYIILKNMGINLGRGDVVQISDKIIKEGI